MDKRKTQSIFLFGVLVVMVIFVASKNAIPEPKPIQGENWDISREVSDNGLQEFLVETSDFNYNNQNVYKLAQEIKSSTATSYDAIKKTAKFVVTNVQYDSKISINYCYDETAASVLEKGSGDCVSMSRLVTALLRAQGIPTRTVGGCLTSSRSCVPLFAVIPTFEARVTPMETGDFKKRGFLHEWVESWSPEHGWMLIEATSGQVFSMDCGSYMIYGYDSNRYDRCIISSADFWNRCATA